MPTPRLYPEIVAALNIGHLSENDQLVFLSEHGDAIFSSALTQLEALLSEPELAHLSDYLETDPELEKLIEFALAHFEVFKAILAAAAAESMTE